MRLCVLALLALLGLFRLESLPDGTDDDAFGP